MKAVSGVGDIDKIVPPFGRLNFPFIRGEGDLVPLSVRFPSKGRGRRGSGPMNLDLEVSSGMDGTKEGEFNTQLSVEKFPSA